jgi:hypothetical protein
MALLPLYIKTQVKISMRNKCWDQWERSIIINFFLKKRRENELKKNTGFLEKMSVILSFR